MSPLLLKILPLQQRSDDGVGLEAVEVDDTHFHRRS